MPRPSMIFSLPFLIHLPIPCRRTGMKDSYNLNQSLTQGMKNQTIFPPFNHEIFLFFTHRILTSLCEPNGISVFIGNKPIQGHSESSSSDDAGISGGRWRETRFVRRKGLRVEATGLPNRGGRRRKDLTRGTLDTS